MKLIIVDKKIPEAAKLKLSEYGELLELETQGITYDAISGHPDIFFTQLGQEMIIAQNLPQIFINELKKNDIRFRKGKKSVGSKYPETAHYNIVANEKYLIHNTKFTDPKIIELTENLEQIHVEQAYTRCNLIALKNNHFITSDKGIEKRLKQNNLKVFYADPQGILLSGFKNGFIGGCAGILGDEFFLTGSLQYYSTGNQLKNFITNLGYQIIELYTGPLFDGGSIMFL